ncbi:MAG: sugar-binding transcriptional regulator [Pseudomonadota bacterium]
MPDDLRKGTAQARESSAADPHSQMRIRAAWLYHIQGMTQAEIAGKLGVNRIMITRLLAEARKRGEVVIRIKSEMAPLAALQTGLEDRFGLERAIVAPNHDPVSDPTRLIAAAAGAYVSGLMDHNMTIGVGWGRTLHMMLPHIEGRKLDGVRVVSLLGGISQARRFNPAEFAWQFAEQFDAEGFLIPAPALVDSAQTRYALLERCGLEQVFQMAESCDVALLSCGGISTLTTSYRFGHVTEAERRSMIEAGVVGDVLYTFLDAQGRIVDHQVNERSVSVGFAKLSRIKTRVLISGGPEKTGILRASMKTLQPHVLVTDEQTASLLLA